MKKILLALLAGMIMAPAALAGTIIISDGAGSPGGIFGVVTSGHGSFQTFCLENNEYLWDYGRQFYYEISTAAIYQGVPGGSDPISLATAWLFVNFRTALPGYVDDAAHNNAIQAAFWFLEGEGGGIDNAYVAAAKIGAGPGWADDANGAYGVYAMNINVFDPGTFEGRLQDLLVVVPVPDGGLTVMLLGLAVGCLALISRRFGS